MGGVGRVGYRAEVRERDARRWRLSLVAGRHCTLPGYAIFFGWHHPGLPESFPSFPIRIPGTAKTNPQPNSQACCPAPRKGCRHVARGCGVFAATPGIAAPHKPQPTPERGCGRSRTNRSHKRQATVNGMRWTIPCLERTAMETPAVRAGCAWLPGYGVRAAIPEIVRGNGVRIAS